MPIYEYSCLQCGRRHEVMQKFSDAPIAECPECGGEMKKLISNTSFVLKGTGWYVTDYAASDRKKGKDADTGAPEKKPAEAKAEGKNEAKSEAKTETNSETKAA
ncbi:MAG: zinc ribbon domain-containing protein [Nitrospirales bacterium]|nr:zinc ribbon domain-containing protein [Nitrospirales bacterium]